MEKIGLIGGIGPASTIDYYRDIIEGYRKVKGDDVYPQIVIESINMNQMIRAFEENRPEEVALQIQEAFSTLVQAKADFGAICSNTPHIVWNRFIDHVTIPVVSIVEETCKEVRKQGYKKVLIFGTKITMKSGLYDNALIKSGVEAILPNDSDIEELGNIIYPNLENGIVIPKDKKRMIEIAEHYIHEFGADSLILGCTEIPLMIKPGDVTVPIINTVDVHVRSIVDLLLE